MLKNVRCFVLMRNKFVSLKVHPFMSLFSSFPHLQLPDGLSSEQLQQAVAILKSGGLVAFPTETVYGLGADAENPAALARLYEVKGRPTHHPVIVHLGSAEQLSEWAVEIPSQAYQLAQAFWPGPLTLILKRSPRVPDAVTGGQDTVGIRVPSHPVALALLKAFGGGVAAPSANRFGRLSPTTAAHVQADLGQDVDLILDGGASDVGVESTIVAFRDNQPIVLRSGMITAEQIQEALAKPIASVTNKPAFSSTVSRAPGTLASHYAPRTPLTLLTPAELDETLTRINTPDWAVGVLARRACPFDLRDKPWLVWQQLEDEPNAAARMLYARLRELDSLSLDQLYVEVVPEEGAWAAVADRLKRAAY